MIKMSKEKKKIKTMKEIREERIRKYKEKYESRYESFRDRLITVRTPGKYWSLLGHRTFFTCGYCGQNILLYSKSAVFRSTENPTLFYGCRKRCNPSRVQRINFLDKKILEFIFKRLKKLFPNLKSENAHIDQLDKVFEKLDSLEKERSRILELLPSAGYNRDELMDRITTVEDEIVYLRGDISGINSENPQESPLLAPIFSIDDPAELEEFSLLYRRELVNSLIMRIRYFNEYLLVRPTPMTNEERRIESEGMGLIENIHLAFDLRNFNELMKDYKNEDQEEEDEEEEQETIDIDFIMSDPDGDDLLNYGKSEPIDVDLIKTEPGSRDEKEILRKKKSTNENEEE